MNQQEFDMVKKVVLHDLDILMDEFCKSANRLFFSLFPEEKFLVQAKGEIDIFWNPVPAPGHSPSCICSLCSPFSVPLLKETEKVLKILPKGEE